MSVEIKRLQVKAKHAIPIFLRTSYAKCTSYGTVQPESFWPQTHMVSSPQWLHWCWNSSFILLLPSPGTDGVSALIHCKGNLDDFSVRLMPLLFRILSEFHLLSFIRKEILLFLFQFPVLCYDQYTALKSFKVSYIMKSTRKDLYLKSFKSENSSTYSVSYQNQFQTQK